MALIFSPQSLGLGWEQMAPGDISTILCQWFEPANKVWRPMPLGTVGCPCRISYNWKRPVTWQAKLGAAWAARSNLFLHYVLRHRTYQPNP